MGCNMLVGVTLQQLRAAERVLAVAGGPAKYLAIRAALLGGVGSTRSSPTGPPRSTSPPSELLPGTMSGHPLAAGARWAGFGHMA